MEKDVKPRRYPRFPLARSAPHVGKLDVQHGTPVQVLKELGGNARDGAGVCAPVNRSPGAAGAADDNASYTEVSCSLGVFDGSGNG